MSNPKSSDSSIGISGDEQDDPEQWRVAGWMRQWGKLNLLVLDMGPSKYDTSSDRRFAWQVSGEGAALSGSKSTKQTALDAAEDAAADLAPKEETP